jgi:hypothetical protein
MIEDYRQEGNKHFFLVDGVWVWPMQNQHAIEVMSLLLSAFGCARYVEIGTAYGGFPIIVRENGFTGVITTYNIKNELNADVEHLFVTHNISHIIRDVFTVVDEIGSLIKSDGRTLLMCDGGDKAMEFNLFANYLKQGDVIVAHDYCNTIQKFENEIKHECWGVCELTYSKIEDTCAKCGIRQIETDVSAMAAYFVGVKI